ncbi:GOGA7 protein, partial [Chloropsis hardwickii]|nr:GOGA7 protein [Chloropsis hardwickii]
MRPQQAPVSGKVFIQRDYSGGTRCQFQSKFPAELENRVRRGGPGPARGSRRARRTEPARRAGPHGPHGPHGPAPGRPWQAPCPDMVVTPVLFPCQVLKKIAKFIQEQNEKIYAPQGLLLTDPIERGLRVIEITIYEDRGLTSGR